MGGFKRQGELVMARDFDRQVAELVRARTERGRWFALVGGSITVWELPG